MKYKALITEEFHPILEIKLKDANIVCHREYDIDTAGVYNIIEEYDIIVINSKIVMDKKMLDKSSQLKIIGRVGSGLDIIDIDECKIRKIKVLASPEGNANAVAEHTLGFILSSFNNFYHSQEQLLKGLWNREENRGEELNGKTIAIIGHGHVGSRFAELLSGFDVTVLIHDIVPKKTTLPNVQMVEMETIYREADIVTLHLPLHKDTFHFANTQFFNQFHKKISFINTSRGKVCDTDALFQSIENGKVKKAMLDVFEQEPLLINDTIRQLVKLNKLYITPHIAGWTIESKFKLAKVLSKKIINEVKT